MVLIPLHHLNLLEQFKHCQAKRIRNDLHGIQGRVCIPVLDPAQVCLVEAAFFPKLNLAQLCL